MKTFTKEQKQHWIDVMTQHREADMLAQGSWWNETEQQGCFYGCATHSDGDETDVLKLAAEMMNLPEWLIRYSEKIFEGLPSDEALDFPVALLKVIPTDYNYGELFKVHHQTSILRLNNLLPTSSDEVNKAVQQVIEYHEKPTEEKGISAARSARSAARSAGSARSAESAAWQKERDWLIGALKEL